MIHGPGNKGNLNLLYNVVKKGTPWPLGAFENKRTFTSIDTLLCCGRSVDQRGVARGVYHMADDEALSTNELIAVICEAMGRRARIWHLNKKMMEMVASAGGCLHLPLNKERLAG